MTVRTEVWKQPTRSPGELRDFGFDPDGIAALEARFAAQLDEGLQPGAQLALYRHGQFVFELGGGLARRSPATPVTGETLFTLLSATKAWTAVAAHILADRGQLDYQAKVADYWPEFAKHGKDAVTVYQALAHRGGYPTSSPDLSLSHEEAIRAIEEAALEWTPGEANGYHRANFGWTVAELVRRIDGRDLQTFLRQELFDRIGLTDSYLGLPADRPDLEERVAYIYEMEENTSGSEYFYGDGTEPPVPEWRYAFNRPEVHRSGRPSSSGLTPARDFARFYGMLANGGEIDGVRVLSPERIEVATRRTNAPGEIDRIMQAPRPWALGFMLGGPEGPLLGRSSSPRAFGHGGGGCTVGWADPDRNLGFAYLTNGNWGGRTLRIRNPRIELADLALKACL